MPVIRNKKPSNEPQPVIGNWSLQRDKFGACKAPEGTEHRNNNLEYHLQIRIVIANMVFQTSHICFISFTQIFKENNFNQLILKNKL